MATFIKSMLAGLVFVVALGGCNTMKGIGQDMGAAGGAIEDSAAKGTTY